MAAPFACLVFWDLGRRAIPDAEKRPLALWIAPSLHAAIALWLLYGPLATMWSPIWLLMPIPLSILDGRIQRAARETPVADDADAGGRPAPIRRLLEAALVAAGLAGVAWGTVQLDGSTAHILLASGEGGVVRGASAAYQLTLGEGRWRRLPPGTLGDPGADLELSSDDQNTWLVVYAHSRDNDIDGLVDARRTLLAAVGTLTDVEEQRFFVGAEAVAPASLARYRLGTTALLRQEYVVLTAELADSVVEAIAYTASPESKADELIELLATFEPVSGKPEVAP